LRLILVGGGVAAIALALPSLRDRPTYQVLGALSVSAAVTSLAAAVATIRAPHTRALGGALILLSVAALARLVAWHMATWAGDSANLRLFAFSRDVATLAVLLAAGGQLVVVMWLGTRGRWIGQLASFLALVAAFLLTTAAAHGAQSGAPPWQALLHTALADAPGVPPPYAFDALATCLVPSSLLLGLVAASLTGQVAAIVSAMSLALVSRGSFDVPLCALCAVAAAQWGALASSDERAMWRTLIGDRKRRLEESAPGAADRAELAKNPTGP
jgi:hypothetical protein